MMALPTPAVILIRALLVHSTSLFLPLILLIFCSPLGSLTVQLLSSSSRRKGTQVLA